MKKHFVTQEGNTKLYFVHKCTTNSFESVDIFKYEFPAEHCANFWQLFVWCVIQIMCSLRICDTSPILNFTGIHYRMRLSNWCNTVQMFVKYLFGLLNRSWTAHEQRLQLLYKPIFTIGLSYLIHVFGMGDVLYVCYGQTTSRFTKTKNSYHVINLITTLPPMHGYKVIMQNTATAESSRLF